MRASRLLSILMVLQARGRTTAEALAAEFEVSVRTIYRDIDQLAATGVPVYADRGRNGGFALLDGYRTRLTGLTPDEAATVFLAGLPGPAADLGVADMMAAAQLKLTAALPEGSRAVARRVATRFHLDPVGWFQDAEDAHLLPDIAGAVWSEKRLQFRYRRWNDIVTRKVLPLGLVLKAGIWYLVAEVNGQPRTYKIANILDVNIGEETFARPADFDLVGFWTTASRAYEASLYRHKAILRVARGALPRLSILGSAVAQAASETARDDEDGWCRIVIPIESVNQAARELLRFGTEVEVISPTSLRLALVAKARDLVQLYKRSRPPGTA